MLETFVYFIRLGTFGFGGPLALVASMQRDLVERRGWLAPEDFSRAFALIKAMPGPVAFQTAVFLGRRRAGFSGALAAAVALNLPAFVMMVLFGVFYSTLSANRGFEGFLMGMQGAALGVILSSTKALGWSHRRKPLFWFLSAVSIATTIALPSLEPLTIILSGIFAALWLARRKAKGTPGPGEQTIIGTDKPSPSDSGPSDSCKSTPLRSASWTTPILVGSSTSAALASGSWISAWIDLAWSSFKAGAFVFGSGIAIVPLMEHDFVQRLGWLTHREFMDALAFGQVTPGPVVITSTFIGYKALGLAGAVTATVAVYAASFFHQVTWFPRVVDRLSKFKWIDAFLTGAIAAVVGAIIATVVSLAMGWSNLALQGTIAITALVLALFSKAPVWSIIPAGGVIAWLATTL